jgi:hypothetical protein
MGTVMHPVESVTICQDWSVPIQFNQTLLHRSVHWNPSETVQTGQYQQYQYQISYGRMFPNLSVPINPFTSCLNCMVSTLQPFIRIFPCWSVPIKGTVAWDGFFDRTILSRIYNKDLILFYFGRTWTSFSEVAECAKIFEQFMRTTGSIYQARWHIIPGPQETKMKFYFFCLPHRKIELCVFSQYAEWPKSCPISVTIGTTVKILSIYPR